MLDKHAAAPGSTSAPDSPGERRPPSQHWGRHLTSPAAPSTSTRSGNDDGAAAAQISDCSRSKNRPPHLHRGALRPEPPNPSPSGDPEGTPAPAPDTSQPNPQPHDGGPSPNPVHVRRLGCNPTEGETPQNRAAADVEADSGWCSDFRKRPEHRYFLKTDFPCQTSQEKLLRGLPTCTRELLAHLLHVRATHRRPFIPAREMREQLTDCPRRTAEAWEPLTARGWLDVQEYSYTAEMARTFTLTDTFLDDWDAAAHSDRRSTRKVSTGARLYADRQMFTTSRYDESGNVYSGLTGAFLTAHPGTRSTVNMEALDRLQTRRAAEIDALPDGHPEAARLRERYHGDALRIHMLKGQAYRDEGDGLGSYAPAYEVQEKSGRVTELGGGVQALTREAKHAAFAGLDCTFNYDQRRAHKAIAADYGRAHGIDVTPLTAFDRAALMEATGATEREAKVLFYAVMYGAAVPRSKAHAVAMRSAVDALTPWTVEAQLERIGDRTGANPCGLYGAAQAFLRPVSDCMARIATHYTGDFFDAHAVNGRGGRGLRNAAGLMFYPDAHAAGRERRTAALTHLTQGVEAALCHALTAIQERHGYTVLHHEHDGVITRGRIPAEAVREAVAMTAEAAGWHLPSVALVLKPYHETAPAHFHAGPDDTQPTNPTHEQPQPQPQPVRRPQTDAGGRVRQTPRHEHTGAPAAPKPVSNGPPGKAVVCGADAAEKSRAEPPTGRA